MRDFQHTLCLMKAFWNKVKCNEETKIKKKKNLLEILMLPSIQEARDENLNLNNFNSD